MQKSDENSHVLESSYSIKKTITTENIATALFLSISPQANMARFTETTWKYSGSYQAADLHFFPPLFSFQFSLSDSTTNVV